MKVAEELSKPKVTLVRATEKDVKKLTAIETAGEGGRMHESCLTEEKWKQHLASHEVWLIRYARKVVGYMTLQHKSPEHVRIHGIVVLPDQKESGIAAAVIRKLIEELQKGVRVDLVSHPQYAAIGMFKTVGFYEESLHENFYGDGEPRLILVYERRA